MSMFFQFEGTDNIFSSAYSENMVDGFRTIFVNISVRVHIWTDFDWIWTAFRDYLSYLSIAYSFSYLFTAFSYLST